MISTIELNRIEMLPDETLAILKDNIDKNEFFSLVLRDTFKDSKNFCFKICFTVVNTVPICVLMLKHNNKFYKCPISFEIMKEFDYFNKLFNCRYFNLFLISNDNKIDVIKVENNSLNRLSNALEEVKKCSLEHSYYDINIAKQELLNTYSDIELWNLN